MINEAEIGNEFVLRFGLADDQHQIKAETLANSLSEITTVLKKINRIGNGGSNIRVYISAPESGSFQINIQLPKKHGRTLALLYLAVEIMPTFIENGEDLDSCVTSIKKLNVYETIVVYENFMNQGKIEIERKYVEKVLNSKKIRNNLSQFFKCAHNDTEVKNIEFSEKYGNNGPLIQIPRSDFLSFQRSNQKPIEIAEEFCDNRLEKILQNNGVIPLKNSGPAVVLHMIPLADFAQQKQNTNISIERLNNDVCPLGVHLFVSRPTDNINSIENYRCYDFQSKPDGFLGHYCNKKRCSYAYVSNSGSIEAVLDNLKNGVVDVGNNPNFISLNDLYRVLIEAFEEGMWLLEKIKASSPILLRTSYFGMEGVSFGDLNVEGELEKKCFDQNEILVPSTIIREYNKVDRSYKKAMKEQFERLLNLIGISDLPRWIKEH